MFFILVISFIDQSYPPFY